MVAVARRQDATISPRIITAIDRAWAAIQGRHPDVPGVVITLGAGSSGRGRGLTYGHFAPGRWQRDTSELPELFVGARAYPAAAAACSAPCCTRPRTAWPWPGASRTPAGRAGSSGSRCTTCHAGPYAVRSPGTRPRRRPAGALLPRCPPRWCCPVRRRRASRAPGRVRGAGPAAPQFASDLPAPALPLNVAITAISSPCGVCAGQCRLCSVRQGGMMPGVRVASTDGAGWTVETVDLTLTGGRATRSRRVTGRPEPVGDGAQLLVRRHGRLVAYCASPDELTVLGVDMSRMAVVARWLPTVPGAGAAGRPNPRPGRRSQSHAAAHRGLRRAPAISLR